jgi:hypothetical protein
MSAFGGKADIAFSERHVLQWPKRPSRYFGKSHSQAKPNNGLKSTAGGQHQEPDDEAVESLKDDVSLAAASGGPDCSD